MLQRDEIEPLLREVTRLAERLDELLARFNGTARGTRPRDFLLWLESQDLLTRVELAQLLDPDDITVTLHRPRHATPQDGATRVRGVTAPAASAPADSDRYVMLGHAGRGGMATVHIARDTELMRRVAYKSLLAEEEIPTPNELTPEQRFIREVQITAQLDHPHIVPVYSLEVHADGRPAYTMKLVEGRTLGAYLEDARAFYLRGAAPDENHELSARLEHFLKVCDAMHYAHSKGIVHRDLKPANIMLGRHNEVYVMDWGICRLLSETAETPQAAPLTAASNDPTLADATADAARTQDGSLMGTPRYMSPEQASGRLRAVGPASDQCALGLILFEVVTLQTPFDGTTIYEVLTNAVRGHIRPIVHAHARQAIPRELIGIIRKATAVAPQARYADVSALADDLRRYLRGAAVLARPDSPWQAAGRWLARHRQTALAVSSVLVVIALAIAGQLLTLREEHRILQEEHRIEELAVARERGLNAVLGALTLQRERLAAVLLRTEHGVERLAATAEQALLYGAPSNEPTDSTRKSGDSGALGDTTPMWSFPAGVDRGGAAARIQRIGRLRDHRGELFAEIDALLSATGERRSPVAGIQLVLADGLTSTYPATAGLPVDFDARRSPWYALDRDGNAHWHPPQESPLPAGRLIAVTSTVRDEADRGIGVAAILLSADELARQVLRPDGIPKATRLLLIDTEGNLVLDSAPTEQPTWSKDAALLQAMRGNHLGYQQTVQGGHAYLAVYSRLPIADWSLLALIDDPQLLTTPWVH